MGKTNAARREPAMWLAAGAAVCWAAFTAPALAQPDTAVNLADERPAAGPFIPPLSRVAQDLAGQGIAVRLQSISAIAADVSGGERRLQDYSGVVLFGADFDLNRIASIPGATFHLTFAQLYGRDLATDAIGSRTKLQSYSYPHKQFELTAFAWEQKLLDNRLDVLVGRTAGTAEFARSSYACAFNNSADCPMELTQLVAGLPGFPYVTWGGRVRGEVAEHVFLKAGAYMIDPGRQETIGFDWSDKTATGVIVPFEASYETDFSTDPMPRHFKLGAWYNSADYSDPFENTKYKSRALFGGTALTRRGGRDGVYAIADQYVWKPAPDSHRGIAIFGAAARPFDSDELFSAQLTGGLEWAGPLASRPADRLGIETTLLQVGHKELGYLDGVIVKNKGRGTLNGSEVLTEINYSVQIIRGVQVLPSVAYIQHPDTINNPHANAATPGAWVLGARLTISMS